MNSTTISPPVILVTVRQGMIQNVDCTIPALVVIEDWDCRDFDTEKFPSRRLDQAGFLPAAKVAQCRILLAEDGILCPKSPQSGGQP